MAIKHLCRNIWDLWGSGWICVPTSPYNIENKISSKIGSYIVSKFPGLKKNYERLCEVNKADFVVFRSTYSRTENPKKILVYNDLRIPLSEDDCGIILLPDSSLSDSEKIDVNSKTDWEIIDQSINLIKENINIIPGKIFIPPLGFDEGRLEEEEAIDNLMANFLDYDKIEIIYNIDTSIDIEELNKKEEEKEPKTVEDWNGENLIEDEFETIEVNIP